MAVKASTIPTLLRTATGEDDDWAGDQTAPPAGELVDLDGRHELFGVTALALDADGAVVASATIDLQPVIYHPKRIKGGAAAGPLVEAGGVDAAVPSGHLATYDVRGAGAFTVRVASALPGGVASVELYGRVIR